MDTKIHDVVDAFSLSSANYFKDLRQWAQGSLTRLSFFNNSLASSSSNVGSIVFLEEDLTCEEEEEERSSEERL